MTQIAPVNGHGTNVQSVAANRLTPYTAGEQAASRLDDRAQFSTVATLMARLEELPDVRADLIARIRGEIQAGTYLTREKIEASLNGIIEDL